MEETQPAGAVLSERAETGPLSEDEFHVLYERTSRPLRAYLYRMLNDRSRADDVLQETYLRFLQARLPAQIGEEHRKNYLFRIATNLLHDHRTEKIAQPLSDAPSRLDLAEEFRGRSDAATYLQQLTGKQRQLLWLAYVEEFTHKEIAAMLRLRTPSIRPMLARARQRLSEILKKEGFRAK